MQHIAHLIRTILFSAALLGVVFVNFTFGTEYLNQQKFWYQSQAVDGCGKLSSYTYTDEKTGVTTVEPTEKTFSRCLQLKGLNQK